MTNSLKRNVQRIANDAAEIPPLRWLAEPIYRRRFERGMSRGNAYYGVHASFEAAQAAAPRTKPTSFDVPAAGELYPDRVDAISVSDYPPLFWLDRLLASGARSVFDLGGNVGLGYYAFGHYVAYPDDLRWTVQDLPSVLDAGRRLALQRGAGARLAFTDDALAADGHDIVLANGVLQYLPFTLPELLRQLPRPPAHLLVNLTPLHPTRSFFTLQQTRIATCPYRIPAVADFVAGFEALGYDVIDRWESRERYMRIPFEAAHSIDRYSGFYFRSRG